MTGDQGTIGGGSSLLGGGLNLGGLSVHSGGQPQQFGGGGTSLLGGAGGGLGGGAPIGGGGGMLMGGLGGQAQPGMGGLPQQVGLGGGKQPQTEAEKIEALMPLIVKLTDPDQVRGNLWFCGAMLWGILVPCLVSQVTDGQGGNKTYRPRAAHSSAWNACRSSSWYHSRHSPACKSRMLVGPLGYVILPQCIMYFI